MQRNVLQLWVEGDGHGGRQRPWRCGPDDGCDFLARERSVNRRRITGHLVTDVDAGAGVLGVLNLSFGEGGAIVDAPVDGAQTLVDEALLKELEECLGDGGLVLEAHGGVGLLPAAEDAEADELLALNVEVLLRVFAAGTADGDGLHLKLLAAELLIDLDLDGQAVAVPAGDVGSVEAGHGAGFNDEVLDALVEGVAEVDGAVGVGRAVVEDVAGATGAGGADLGVEVGFSPLGQTKRLIHWQIGLHGEGGLREVERAFQGIRLGCITFLVHK